MGCSSLRGSLDRILVACQYPCMSHKHTLCKEKVLLTLPQQHRRLGRASDGFRSNVAGLLKLVWAARYDFISRQAFDTQHQVDI